MEHEENAPSCQVKKLLWGPKPSAALDLKHELDFVLAADVVYGSSPEVWDALLETFRALSGSRTFVVIADVRRLQCDARHFWNMVQKDFKMKLLPQSSLHPQFRGDGDGSCVIYVLR